jgi:hypothetical protein
MSNDGNDNESAFSDEDIGNIISDEDLRSRSQALNDAQEVWEEVAYMANPKMPCPECSGAGNVSSGSLGDICVRCMGSRVVDQPGSTGIDMPPFRELRAAITAYGDARADRALPEGVVIGGPRAGQPIRRRLALPAAATVPTLEQLQALRQQALTTARQLQGAPGVVPKGELAAPKTSKGLAGEGDLSEYEDAELDSMQDDA